MKNLSFSKSKIIPALLISFLIIAFTLPIQASGTKTTSHQTDECHDQNQSLQQYLEYLHDLLAGLVGGGATPDLTTPESPINTPIPTCTTPTR